MSRYDHVSRLAEISALQPGWYDGKGEAIGSRSLQAAARFFEDTILADGPLAGTLCTAPLAEGDVLIEFQAGQWDIGLQAEQSGGVIWFGVDKDAVSGDNSADFHHEFDDIDQALDYLKTSAFAKDLFKQT